MQKNVGRSREVGTLALVSAHHTAIGEDKPKVLHRMPSGAADLYAAAEQFIVADEERRRSAFRILLDGMGVAKSTGRFEELAAALRFTLSPALDYTSAQSFNRFYKALPEEAQRRSKIRLAILGGFTT